MALWSCPTARSSRLPHGRRVDVVRGHFGPMWPRSAAVVARSSTIMWSRFSVQVAAGTAAVASGGLPPGHQTPHAHADRYSKVSIGNRDLDVLNAATLLGIRGPPVVRGSHVLFSRRHISHDLPLACCGRRSVSLPALPPPTTVVVTGLPGPAAESPSVVSSCCLPGVRQPAVSSLTVIEAVSNAVISSSPPRAQLPAAPGPGNRGCHPGPPWSRGSHGWHSRDARLTPTACRRSSPRRPGFFGYSFAGTGLSILVHAATALMPYTRGNTSFTASRSWATSWPRTLPAVGAGDQSAAHRLVFLPNGITSCSKRCFRAPWWLAAIGANGNRLVPFYANRRLHRLHAWPDSHGQNKHHTHQEGPGCANW